MKHCFLLLLLGALGFIRHAAGWLGPPAKEKTSAYLFVYFTGNDIKEEAIRFALSPDGYHYTALNGNRPVISSAAISETGGVRDPHILRGADGKTFYMVATDMVSAKGWDSNRGMVLMKSTDLITWKSSAINFQKRYPGQENLKRVWAPQTIYDAQAGKYLVYFSLKHGTDPDKIYYAYANKDFTDLEGEPKQLFVSPTNGSCIDGDIVAKDGKFYLFFKTEGQGNGIKIAVSDKLTGGYVLRDQYVQQTTDPVEGAGTFKLNNSNDYILMYDVYTKGRYQFTRTSDLRNFKVVDGEVSMDFHPRHGTVLPITAQEGARLASRWLAPAAVLRSARNPAIRPQNTVADSAAGKLSFLAKPGTNLKVFDPALSTFAGVAVQPAGPQDFTKGPVRYTVSGTNQKQSVSLSITETHNPALTGYYADPAILYSEKTGKFYLYPTSDGFTGWSGTYFKAFSSPDLVNWKDEGVILDLGNDVNWAKKNAWAPCIIEQKTATGYKYAYYFCAEAKIGVALADSPTGPFVDSGKPLIDTRPEGVKGGQQIDPAVFHDPQTGKNYLYWGNGYLAGAELNDDLTSLKPGTTQVLTPDGTFREGTHVLYRNGTYYFMWSENDTRDPDYRVRYGTAISPLGKITVPANNLVVSKDTAAGLYGTGHNSTIQVPGRDEWYLVYHRFTYPQGITMGRAAGYHREVCIDKLEFNADGSIKPVTPTHAGIPLVRVK
ncbi:family 43 glycosylhydrolase [Hymenobacter negativus]|uniref:Family 43 glycosylhydrolase n=1 Tax=Hymenobacter negativus TaxID=2795026 RepID=A0ABS0Q6J3_9BACT|nr:family 43 glycosylhydrolase [Hymenobacter negativus]MBH8558117.1 family 43 glycosylhydrolase [Hymenobacter negativus]